MSRLTTAVVIGALLAAPLAVVAASAADAATPPRYNVARAFCDDDHGHRALKRDCILHADDDEGDLTVLNHGGRVIHLRTVAAAKRYFRVHATPCATEDSNACFWDAGRRGNHRGSSFITVDGIVLPLWLYV